MKTHHISGLIALFLALIAPTALAQDAITNVIYLNGIQNTLEDAQLTRGAIDNNLKLSNNHTTAVNRRTFNVELIWNPIGWYGTSYDLLVGTGDLTQDKMELFLLKTAEENFEADFIKILSPHDRPVAVNATAAANVASFLNTILS